MIYFVPPIGSHVVDLPLKTFRVFRRMLRSAGGGFVMVEFGVRGPDVAIASFFQPEAKIDIVEGNGKIGLIETADLLERRFSNDQTSAGDCRHRGGKNVSTKISGV